jgi:hypothetical protein
MLHCSLQDTTPCAFVETFAGQAEVTRAFREANYRCARLDLLYMDGNKDGGSGNPMDLCTPEGMASLGQTCMVFTMPPLDTTRSFIRACFWMELFPINPMDHISLLLTTNLQDSSGHHVEGGLDQWMVGPLWFEMLHMDGSEFWYFQPWTLLFNWKHEFSKREGRQLSRKSELHLHLIHFDFCLLNHHIV